MQGKRDIRSSRVGLAVQHILSQNQNRNSEQTRANSPTHGEAYVPVYSEGAGNAGKRV